MSLYLGKGIVYIRFLSHIPNASLRQSISDSSGICERGQRADNARLRYTSPILSRSIILKGFAAFVNRFQGGICEFRSYFFYALFNGFLGYSCDSLFCNASRYIIEIAGAGEFPESTKHFLGCHFNRSTCQAISETGIIPGTVFVCLLGCVTGGACPQGCETCHLSDGGGRSRSARCNRNRNSRKHLPYAACNSLDNSSVLRVGILREFLKRVSYVFSYPIRSDMGFYGVLEVIAKNTTNSADNAGAEVVHSFKTFQCPRDDIRGNISNRGDCSREKVLAFDLFLAILFIEFRLGYLFFVVLLLFKVFVVGNNIFPLLYQGLRSRPPFSRCQIICHNYPLF